MELGNGITLDISDGTSTSWTEAGTKDTQVAKVNGLTKTDSGPKQRFDAKQILVDAGYDIGRQHDESPLLYISNIDVTKQVCGTVWFNLVYVSPGFNSGLTGQRTPSFNTVRGRMSSVQIERSYDKDGNPLLLHYVFPNSGTHLGETLAVRTKDLTGSMSVMIPTVTLTIAQMEYVNPTAKAIAYGYKVNSGGFILVPAASAECWLLTDLDYMSKDAGQSWEVSYTFQGIDAGWNSQLLSYKDPATGQMPAENLVEGYSHYFPKMYAQANFNNLGISLIA
jgi:hypothetical protein